MFFQNVLNAAQFLLFSEAQLGIKLQKLLKADLNMTKLTQ